MHLMITILYCSTTWRQAAPAHPQSSGATSTTSTSTLTAGDPQISMSLGPMAGLLPERSLSTTSAPGCMAVMGAALRAPGRNLAGKGGGGRGGGRRKGVPTPRVSEVVVMNSNCSRAVVVLVEAKGRQLSNSYRGVHDAYYDEIIRCIH